VSLRLLLAVAAVLGAGNPNDEPAALLPARRRRRKAHRRLLRANARARRPEPTAVGRATVIAFTLLRIGVLRLDHRDSSARASCAREALRAARGELQLDIIIDGDETTARPPVLDDPEIGAPWLQLDPARLAPGVVDDLRDDEAVFALEVLLEIQIPGVRVCRHRDLRGVRMPSLIGRTAWIRWNEVLRNGLACGLKFLGHFGETLEAFVCFDDRQLVRLSRCHGAPAGCRRQIALGVQWRRAQQTRNRSTRHECRARRQNDSVR